METGKTTSSLIERSVSTSGATEVKLKSYIGETPLARYYYAWFKWNSFSEPRLVYAVENLQSGEGLTLKGCLDSFCERILIEHANADAYKEVLPLTLRCYMDEVIVENHALMLYAIEDRKPAYRVLDFSAAERWSINDVVWATERLLRVAEALHQDDLNVDLNRPVYLVDRSARALKLMDFRQLRYTMNVSYYDARNSLMQVAEVVRQLGDFTQGDSATKKLDSFLVRIEQLPWNGEIDPDLTQQMRVAAMRKEFLSIFPEAKAN